VSDELRLARCSSCGLDYFPAAVPGDEGFYQGLAAAMPYHADRWEFGLVIRRIPAGAAVVDFGSGDGAFLLRAAGRAGRVVGVDHNSRAIGRLADVGIEGSTETFEEFADRESGAFDVACSFHTLEHVPSAAGLVRAAARCLRPGGGLFLSVPNRDRAGRRDDEPLDCPPHHLSRWAPQQLEELARRLGLELIDVRFEEPDLSHVREAARRRSLSTLARLGVHDDRHLLARAWAKAATGPRRYRRRVSAGAYTRRDVCGHSMLAELRVPDIGR
jgi:SAM-dependent methyltransferase